MSLIITPELIDTYLSLTYPRTTHVSFTDSAELLRRGYTDAQVRGILGENLLGVMEQVEAAAGDAAAAAPAASSAPNSRSRRRLTATRSSSARAGRSR